MTSSDRPSTSKPVQFWVDPVCPWCWVTARWIIEIAPERGLEIEWQPISLLIKNEVQPDSSFYPVVHWTYGLLRVMESVRAEDPSRVGDLYVEYGRRIHHDRERLWDPKLALAAVGLDTMHAAAADSEEFDVELRSRMDAGLALVGDQVGTPIIAFRSDDGRDVAAFGPVITKVPERAKALALWDAFVTVTELEEFWEIKRTRTVGPAFGDRP